ncbi:response regulator transcription factor [Salinisphaera sp. Q1T1-3]|uniref:response regulator transcription factor n=1 Tax=Salinisphaera sp. Q1T1-3 TaxID=2321229 RepID=UPI000E71C915|nr:response regulator transcription factor [Salinisphaera sp. Q1T1-3]RJS95247.1 DNA-binding response regulator [Salinisphaera sp. Q1T1-3]
MHVLIIEDDPQLAMHIGDALESAGDEPDFADDVPLAIRLCEMNRYDAILLDATLPKCGDAQCFTERLRDAARRDTPVLALAARHELLCHCRGERMRSAVFRAEDDPTLLLKGLHRLVAECGDPLSQLSAGDLHMDLERQSVYCGQVPVELAPISFRILELLVRAFPGVVTRAQIEKQIWNDQPPESDAALRGHIHRLRQLLERPTARKMIRTVHGIGYQLDAAVQRAS